MSPEAPVTVPPVPMHLFTEAASPAPSLDTESERWLVALRASGHERDRAVSRLHGLLLRAARFEVGRRRSAVVRLSAGDVDDLANQAADDALLAVLRKLDTYRGASRFTTWAYKFALYEAAVSVRRRSWQNREIPLESESWSLMAVNEGGPAAEAETGELFDAVREGIGSVLTSRQREVLVALAINGVPIDVLAERLSTTRGALYKTLHDARRKLRAELGERGFALNGEGRER